MQQKGFNGSSLKRVSLQSRTKAEGKEIGELRERERESKRGKD